MDRKQLRSLMAERTALIKLISETPEEDVIDRGALQAKLEHVEASIQNAQPSPAPARTRLTFSGRPVFGTHGIYADFAMKAVNGFAEAVAAVAASLTAPLSPSGPIPNREQNQLLITNTAIGSFGFELEEVPAVQAPLGVESAVDQALDKAQLILIAAASDDDDALAELASEVDRRALDKIRSFVETLQANDALCAMNFKGRQFRFSNAADVDRTILRMSSSNLQETEEVISGRFVGALPFKRRTFEFRREAGGDVIVGRFGAGVSSPEGVNSHIGEFCSPRFLVTRVGQGRPRYQLVEMPDWS